MLVGAADVLLQQNQNQNQTDKTPNETTSGGRRAISIVDGPYSKTGKTTTKQYKCHYKIIQYPLQNNKVANQNKRGRNRSS